MITSTRPLSAVALASLAALAACSAGTDSSGSPAKLQQLGTAPLTGRPGSELGDSIRVKVLTSDDQPVEHATVQWVAKIGGGSAGAGTTNTNADGIAANTWTLGQATGEQTLEVTVPGTKVPALTITATAQTSSGGDGAPDVGRTRP